MNSIILRTGTVFILPLLLLVSVVILLRGHNEPGGGFVGGLTAATAMLLHMLAFGPKEARKLLPIGPEAMIGVGLLLALFSGIPAMFAGLPAFKALWTDFEPVQGVKFSTPLIFDVGVYLTVAGVVILIIFSIAEYRGHRAIDAQHASDARAREEAS
ncbi:MAG: Na+/H+ antiporter subunit B [Phycisphaerales bacterium]|nr:Na+/H+ antiporter subunit B [Planctomycetota bacterium]MCH8508015.1 Na+/H+ antiporter subunit B [Phycisphaerales bacterium]